MSLILKLFVLTISLFSVSNVLAQSVLKPAPAWVHSIAPGTWTAVGTNTLSQLDPGRDAEVNPRFPRSAPWHGVSGQSAILGAWNGGALATEYGEKGALIICGGGHADYYGNEVYAFDLAKLTWFRLTNPYPTPSFPVQDGIWPDGSPSVSHTYDQAEYHAKTNSFVMLKTQHDNTGGRSSPVVALFPLDKLSPPINNTNRESNRKLWRLSPRNTKNFTNSGGWSAYDSKRDLFWANGGSGTDTFASFEPYSIQANDRVGSFQNYPHRAAITDAVAAYDPNNDLILVTIFRHSPNIRAIDLKTPGGGTSANVSLLQAGTPPAGLDSAHGWEWSPTRQAFVYYQRGADVHEFKQPPNSQWSTTAWRWAPLLSPENTLIPEGLVKNGTYGKFRIMQYADAEIAIVVHSTKGPVYVFRMPTDLKISPEPPAALTVK